MKNIIILLFVSISLFSCSKDDNDGLKKDPMTLRVVNDLDDYYYITSVKLVGYEFESLKIHGGESQTLELKNGMPGGLDDVNVIVSYRSSPYSLWRANASIDFNEAGSTTITLKGCTAEGCDGIKLE